MRPLLFNIITLWICKDFSKCLNFTVSQAYNVIIWNSLLSTIKQIKAVSDFNLEEV